MSELTEEQLSILDGEIDKLDHDDETHWTKAGLPNCARLTATEEIDFTVTKAVISERYPDVKRGVPEATSEPAEAPRQATLNECLAMKAKHDKQRAEAKAKAENKDQK